MTDEQTTNPPAGDPPEPPTPPTPAEQLLADVTAETTIDAAIGVFLDGISAAGTKKDTDALLADLDADPLALYQAVVANTDYAESQAWAEVLGVPSPTDNAANANPVVARGTPDETLQVGQTEDEFAEVTASDDEDEDDFAAGGEPS